MKKFVIGFGVIILAFLAVFFWLASQGSAEQAPKTPVIVDLPDSYEK